MFGTTCLSGGEKGEWSGSQGKAPVHRDNSGISSLPPSAAQKPGECDCVYVSGCRGVTVIYGSCAQTGNYGASLYFFFHQQAGGGSQRLNLASQKCKVHTIFWFADNFLDRAGSVYLNTDYNEMLVISDVKSNLI